MTFNSYYCFVDEKKLTESEWEAVHADDVKYNWHDEEGYWHCDSYATYSKEFDECMAFQIENRDNLRKWYVRLMKAPFNDAWAESYGDFNENFKACYGRSPWFKKDMLKAKGVTWEDVSKAWDRVCKEA